MSWNNDASGQVVHSFEQGVQWDTGVNALYREKNDTSSWSGEYRVSMKCVGEDGTVVAASEGEVEVFAPESFTKPKSMVAAIDPEGRLEPLIRQYGLEVVPFSSDLPTSTPVLVWTKAVPRFWLIGRSLPGGGCLLPCMLEILE